MIEWKARMDKWKDLFDAGTREALKHDKETCVNGKETKTAEMRDE
jgi:hypothetical protein